MKKLILIVAVAIVGLAAAAGAGLNGSRNQIPQEKMVFFPGKNSLISYTTLDTPEPIGAETLEQMATDGLMFRTILQLPDGTYRSYFVQEYVMGGYTGPLSGH